MCQQLSELQRLEFKEAFLEFDKVSKTLFLYDLFCENVIVMQTLKDQNLLSNFTFATSPVDL